MEKQEQPRASQSGKVPALYLSECRCRTGQGQVAASSSSGKVAASGARAGAASLEGKNERTSTHPGTQEGQDWTGQEGGRA